MICTERSPPELRFLLEVHFVALFGCKAEYEQSTQFFSEGTKWGLKTNKQKKWKDYHKFNSIDLNPSHGFPRPTLDQVHKRWQICSPHLKVAAQWAAPESVMLTATCRPGLLIPIREVHVCHTVGAPLCSMTWMWPRRVLQKKQLSFQFLENMS